MAEYYPLLSRAVAGLRDAPPEQRKAIYERARQALLGQLRSMQPAVPDEAIERESAALDEAIERVEAEIPKRVPLSGQGAAARVDPIVTIPAPRPDPAPTAAPPGPTVSSTRNASAPASAAAGPQAAPAARPRPPATAIPALRLPSAPQRSTTARPAADALTRIIADRPPPSPAVRPTRTENEPSPPPARMSAALPAAPRLQVPTVAGGESAAERVPDGPALEAAAGKSDAVASAGRDDAVRPAAPRPVTRDRFNPRLAIMIGIALLVVIPIAYAAWRLRDKPEALARSRAALLAAEQADRQTKGKTSNRADGSPAPSIDQPAPVASSSAPPAEATPMPPPAASQPSAPPPQAASGTSPAPASALPPAPDTPPAATPDPAPVKTVATPPAMPTPLAPTTPVPASPAAAQPAAAQPAAAQPAADAAQVPVSQRAAFLIDAPDEPQKIKTLVGNVVWRSESVSPGSGQPLMTTVHADVDIPDAAMKLSLTFQRNIEPQFPASHTLDLRFSLVANNTLGGVKQISVPQMRQDDSPTGDSLIGLPVTITENYFLVGLSRGEPVAENINLIRTRNWFDIPMLMTSGKVAKITFEKGATGQQVIENALQSWQ